MQLVEAVRYKPVGCGFDSPWGHWDSLIAFILPSALRPSASNKNGGKGDKGGRCVGLNLPRSCGDCLEILGASNSWSPKSLPRPVQIQFYLYYHKYNQHYCSPAL